MYQTESIQDYVQAMSGPEELVSLLPDCGMSKDYDDAHDDKQEHTSYSLNQIITNLHCFLKRNLPVMVWNNQNVISGL